MKTHPTSGLACLRVAAFTVVELVCAIALAAVLLASLAFAFRPGGAQAATLRSGQATVASLLDSARLDALSRQAPARLLIYAQAPPAGDASKYLRYLQVVHGGPEGGAPWLPSGDAAYLPRGVYVVPPGLHGSVLCSPASYVFAGAGMDLAYSIGFSASGRSDSASGSIVIAAATPSPGSPPTFDNPSSARGVRVRPGGSIALTDETTGY